MRTISKDNPQLYGIFGDAPWTNKNRLSDETLRNLIEHFSSETLTLARVSDDMLGKGYEYLIKKFADDSGHTAAEFYTNRTVVRLMTQLLDPQPGESVYDPTCGSGGMLLEAAMELRDQGREYRNLRLYGQEINLMTSAMARMNLFMHGFEDFEVVRGDTLASPAFIRDDELRQFDVVLANPPYSIKQWDRDAWATDHYGRNFLGVPPQGRADYAFLQHIVKSLKPASGRCAILFPHGILFRDEERAMRTRLLEEHDLVECVIGLGPNLFYNSPMEACVLICRRNKDRTRQNRVLFINAISRVTRRQAQSFLDDQHIAEIVQAYQAYTDVEGFSRVVPVEDILANAGSLSISLYIRTPNGKNGSEKALGEVIADWQASSFGLRESMQSLLTQISTPIVTPSVEPLPIPIALESMRMVGGTLQELHSIALSPVGTQDALRAMLGSVAEIAPLMNPFSGMVDQLAATIPQIDAKILAAFSLGTTVDYSEMMRNIMQPFDLSAVLGLGTPDAMTASLSAATGLGSFQEVVKTALQTIGGNLPVLGFADTLLGGLTIDHAAALRGFIGDIEGKAEEDFTVTTEVLSGVLPFEELPEAVNHQLSELRKFVFENGISVTVLLLWALNWLWIVHDKSLESMSAAVGNLLTILLLIKEMSDKERKQ
jgi:type I restriction enzyme M protein